MPQDGLSTPTPTRPTHPPLDGPHGPFPAAWRGPRQMRATRARLEAIATRAREWAESVANLEDCPIYACPDDLCGMCATASVYLATQLLHNGIPAIICVARHHCWVRVGRNVVDVTATQFGGPPVYIGKPQDYHVRNHRNFHSPLCATAYCESIGWGEQSPQRAVESMLLTLEVP